MDVAEPAGRLEREADVARVVFFPERVRQPDQLELVADAVAGSETDREITAAFAAEDVRDPLGEVERENTVSGRVQHELLPGAGPVTAGAED